MGMLFNEATGERILLRAEHVFGRNPLRSDTHLADPEVSMMHAAVRWRDGAWSIADHSRNGTFQDGRVPPKGQWTPLRVGQALRFGAGSLSSWQVVDLSAPATSLVARDGLLAPITLERSNLLPNAKSPELSVYQTAAGHWILERDGEARKLTDGDPVEFAGGRYQLFVNNNIDETAAANALPHAERPILSFRVSRDEEHAHLQIVQGSHAIDLGERSHHYCLVTLARQRLADAHAGLHSDAQGWLDSAQLAKQLGIDLPHLNIQIFRARNQLMSAMPDAAQLANIVERRRGGLRLGEFAFEIVRGQHTPSRNRPGAESIARQR